MNKIKENFFDNPKKQEVKTQGNKGDYLDKMKELIDMFSTCSISIEKRFKTIKKILLEEPDWQIRDVALKMILETGLTKEERFEIIKIALRDQHPDISKRAEKYLKSYYPEEYAKYIQEEKQKPQKKIDNYY